MGIDHGLGGRDGVKSKQKREKKAKKNRVVAMRALTGGRKKEVIFDEKARTEWLGGFHKRKQERRKYGLAMEVRLISFFFALIIAEEFTHQYVIFCIGSQKEQDP